MVLNISIAMETMQGAIYQKLLNWRRQHKIYTRGSCWQWVGK